MKYTCEENLTNFKFWSGAEDRVKNLTYDELDTLDSILPDYFGEEPPTDTEINDMFWFDFPTVCHALEYACVGDEPVREYGDFKEDYRIEKLTEYAKDAGWKFTDEQIKELDKLCIEDSSGAYPACTLNYDEDTFDIDDAYIETLAEQAGIILNPED